MTLSRNLGRYADIQQVFDAVLKNGPAILTFPSAGKAHYWRMRAYYFRQLLHDRQSKQGDFTVTFTATPYDELIIRQDEERLTISRVELEATVTFAEGPKELPASVEVPLEDVPDDLETAAFDFVQELTGGKK